MLINTHEPHIMPAQAAYDYVRSLNRTESEGWSYRVVVNPATGLALIMVYDEDGNVCGPL
jgi:hypothetical protein